MMRDWREDALENVEQFRGVAFRLKSYTPYRPGWDRDLCELCFAKFTQAGMNIDGAQHEGFASTDSYVHGADVAWFCAECFIFLKPRLELIDETERN